MRAFYHSTILHQRNSASHFLAPCFVSFNFFTHNELSTILNTLEHVLLICYSTPKHFDHWATNGNRIMYMKSQMEEMMKTFQNVGLTHGINGRELLTVKEKMKTLWNSVLPNSLT